MDVHWIRVKPGTAAEALEGIERQVLEGDRGSLRLEAALVILRSEAKIRPHDLPEAGSGPLPRAVHRLRAFFVGKVFWWFGLKQWGQASDFNTAAVNAIDALVEENDDLRRRIALLERSHPGEN